MIYTKNKLKEISFPIGGIGSGCIGLAGDGRLIDFEIFNRPNKLSINGFTNFAIKAQNENEVLDARILQGEILKDFSGNHISSHGSWGYGQGVHRCTMAGFPHFDNVSFDGFYPLAKVDYSDENFPGKVTMSALNPFIPNNSKDSSLPVALFKIKIKNTTNEKLKYSLAFSCCNPFEKAGENKAFIDGSLKGITMLSNSKNNQDVQFGSMSILTDCEESILQEYWFRGSWFDDSQIFWREFSSIEGLNHRHYGKNAEHTSPEVCSVCTSVNINPNEEKEITFILTWYIPNCEKYWDSSKVVFKNYYSSLFSSSFDVAKYCYKNLDVLWNDTIKFKNTLENSSLPDEVLDAIQGNISILKSSTCLRLENGDFWAWEGANQNAGSCEGTCSHVWNYAYAMPFLFPDLERNIRSLEYDYNMKENGDTKFRMMLPIGSKVWDFRACADGLFGGIIKFYREWKISGDDEWLKKYWHKIQKSLEFTWSQENPDRWDINKTGVLMGRQHHTLDMEFFGANSWLTGFYLAALKAASEMAEYLGEAQAANEYKELLKKGQAYLEKELFNGKHYVQKIDITDKKILESYENIDEYWSDELNQIKYQYKDGVIIDQCIAQWHANLCGLGEIFDKRNCKKAMQALYENNFKKMNKIYNPCRIFAVNNEQGLIICNWENEEQKPLIPIPYTEEVMTGFEYAAACLMLQNGFENEALDIVKAIRERYDGEKRNPWSEIECGSSYARAMASYSFLITYSGFTYDLSKAQIGFAPINKPRNNEEQRYFWSVGSAWGEAICTKDNLKVNVLYGNIDLKSIFYYGVKCN